MNIPERLPEDAFWELENELNEEVWDECKGNDLLNQGHKCPYSEFGTGKHPLAGYFPILPFFLCRG